MNLITKSGTNEIRGEFWEFNRNDALTQSYDAIAEMNRITPPRLNRNQFGANIGGPVLLPKLYHGKDKTFFFFNWESGYAAQGSTSRLSDRAPGRHPHRRFHRSGQRADESADPASRSDSPARPSRTISFRLRA